jgi:hypothetical protein
VYLGEKDTLSMFKQRRGIQLRKEKKMKHIPLFDHRHKRTHSQNDKMKSHVILEFDRLEGTFIRLRNLSILGKDRIAISDREKRAKLEGYAQAFTYAADLMRKAKKYLLKNENRNHEVRTNDMQKTMPLINRTK